MGNIFNNRNFGYDNSECYESYPCKHRVKYRDDNGKMVEKLMTSIEIYNFCKSNDISIPKHIKKAYNRFFSKK